MPTPSAEHHHHHPDEAVPLATAQSEAVPEQPNEEPMRIQEILPHVNLDKMTARTLAELLRSYEMNDKYPNTPEMLEVMYGDELADIEIEQARLELDRLKAEIAKLKAEAASDLADAARDP